MIWSNMMLYQFRYYPVWYIVSHNIHIQCITTIYTHVCAHAYTADNMHAYIHTCIHACIYWFSCRKLGWNLERDSTCVYCSRAFRFGRFMPPPLCAKCRETTAAEGDSWCLGCTAWEALGRELAGHWDSSGARVLANDLVVSCVRQVRGLRSLSAGLTRSADKAASAGPGRALASRASCEPPSVQTRASSPKTSSSWSSATSQGSEEGTRGVRRLRRGRRGRRRGQSRHFVTTGASAKRKLQVQIGVPAEKDPEHMPAKEPMALAVAVSVSLRSGDRKSGGRDHRQKPKRKRKRSWPKTPKAV